MTTLFISDLHLSESRPDITACFLKLLDKEASQAQALYILGDLFDTWFGDDDDNALNRRVKRAFHRLTKQGVACYFVHGNRDFLVGKRFSLETGVQLLPENTEINLYGQPCLIGHGDALCTLDVSYQKYRQFINRRWVQWIFLHLPLKMRHKIVGNIKSSSRDDKQRKTVDVMDVTPEEVVKLMGRRQCQLMIHGHTHRAAIHQLQVNGQQAKRIVLGDWFDQASVLVCTESEISLETRPLD